MRSLRSGSSALFRAATFCIVLPGLAAGLLASVASSAQAAVVLEERKLPMRFTWVACEPNCRGWIGAVGIVTGDTVRDFDEFSKGRDLTDATVVLDSSGGSVNDAITMGRRWRKLGLRTTVGITVDQQSSSGAMKPAVVPQAYCESMCVFLLLAGKIRYVSEESQVRVHQIWMGDRADDPKAASYTANDLMIVERDIGRLAKYTFDMGGTGDLLSLSLSVPPWDDLHRLTETELELTNLITTHSVGDVLSEPRDQETPVASLAPKSVQDRFVSGPENENTPVASSPVASSAKSTKTAEASVPTGGVVSAASGK
ncbi:hypothetical protein [Tardiphaga sp. 768_D3_N2_1]|uniref:hypothetical protein n=1 Tax=Tardiphaga sp. 768_D3_N2_1 TaxID=3240783 RepID=UPI003F8C5B65